MNIQAMLTGEHAIFYIGGAVGACVLILFWMLFSMTNTVLEGYRSGYSEAVQGQLQGMFLFITPQQLFVMKLAAAMMGGLIFALMTIGTGILFVSLVAGLLGALIFFFIPDKILRFLYEQRLAKFNDQLVDALSSMSNGLRSGLNFTQAIGVLVEDMPAPISQEFNLVLQEIKLGVQTDKALDSLAARVPDDDLKILVIAINIARGIGGNLAEIFENIAGVVRERKRIEGKVKAITAQGKLQAIVMASMPLVIALALHFIDADTLRYLYTTWQGILIIVLVSLFDYIGYRVILSIVTIDI